ncbi:hypothetical protein C8Q78DRAFT_1078076 [Trametes maxima]|nr:hypothetical protein C8Q78DRAFT_1078076 [Trametes maxima]
MASGSLYLTEDVLLEVIAAARLQDGAAFMRTSRFFYSEGPRALLRRTVKLQSKFKVEELTPFFAFLGVEGGRRFNFVRSLDIAIQVGSQQRILWLLNLLQFMPNLCSLWLELSSSNQLEIPKKLFDTLYERRNHSVVLLKAFRSIELLTDFTPFPSIGLVFPLLSNLGKISMTIVSEEQLINFLALLRTQPHNRLFGAVRRLYLSDFTIIPETCSELINAIPLMSHVVSINWRGTCYLFLGSDPMLVDAFAAMTSLKQLSVNFSGQHGFHIDYGTMFGFEGPQVIAQALGDLDDEALLQRHPVELLSHCSSTLEEMKVRNWRPKPFSGVFCVFPDHPGVFPKMAKICVQTNLIPPYAVVLIRVYPNLTHLEYRPRGYLRVPGEPHFPEQEYGSLEDLRERNVSEQVTQGITWRLLREYVGPLSVLYALGLTCPIDTIRLYTERDPDAVHHLHTALSSARPRQLSLEYASSLLDDGSPGVVTCIWELPAALDTTRGGSRLQDLRIRFSLRGNCAEDESTDIGALLENLLHSLWASCIQQFTLVVELDLLDSVAVSQSQGPYNPYMLYSLRPTSVEDHPLGYSDIAAGEYEVGRPARTEKSGDLGGRGIVFQGIQSNPEGSGLSVMVRVYDGKRLDVELGRMQTYIPAHGGRNSYNAYMQT